VFCPSCGVKNEGSPLKCFICGYILPSGDRIPSGDSPRRARSRAQAAAAAEPLAAIGDRMLALILDRLLLLAILAIPAAFLAERWSRIDSSITAPLRVAILAAVAVTIAILVYHIVLETVFGATLGKGLLGLQVRDAGDDGRWLAITIRNVMRLVDSIFLYAFAFLVAAFSSRRQRLGDHIAGTTVIEHRVEWGARIALIFIWLALVVGSLWLAGWLCPACVPDRQRFGL
jgi:uncharacterized RDD family membrane protein YckC